MSFIRETEKGRMPGYFLESEVGVVRKTRQISQADATNINNEKYVIGGTVWPANDATAEGIVYEDVCVTSGDMPGSVVLEGRVYEDRLPAAVSDAAKTALESSGIRFIANFPEITRPY